MTPWLFLRETRPLSSLSTTQTHCAASASASASARGLDVAGARSAKRSSGIGRSILLAVAAVAVVVGCCCWRMCLGGAGRARSGWWREDMGGCWGERSGTLYSSSSRNRPSVSLTTAGRPASREIQIARGATCERASAGVLLTCLRIYIFLYCFLHCSHATNFDHGEPAQARLEPGERRTHLHMDQDVRKQLAPPGKTQSRHHSLVWFDFTLSG